MQDFFGKRKYKDVCKINNQTQMETNFNIKLVTNWQLDKLVHYKVVEY